MPKSYPICLNEDEVNPEMFVKSIDNKEYQMAHSSAEKCQADYGFSLESTHFCGTEVYSEQCRIGAGTAAVTINSAGHPVLSGIYIGKDTDQTCNKDNFSTGIFANVGSYATWLKSAARHLADYHDENYVQPTSEQISAFDAAYSEAENKCSAPFASVQVKFAAGFDGNFDDLGKLHGGKEITKFDEWNFLANIDGKCSGTFIGGKFIVTAAHCCLGQIVGAKVSFGTVAEAKVSRHWSHPDFVVSTFANNVCVIELDTDLTDHSGVEPLCFRDSNLYFSTNDNIVPGYIAGYGEMNNGLKVANTATVAIMPQSECKRAYRRVYDENTQFCAGSSQGGVDACKGDSGGPLVTIGVNSNRELSGIFIYGQGCGQDSTTAPGVYLDLNSYRGWIYDIIAAAITVTDTKPTLSADAEAQLELEEIKEIGSFLMPSEVNSYYCASPFDSPQRSILNKLEYDALSAKEGFRMASWPFSVNFHRKCSGVLINSNSVLTSA